MNLVVLQIFPAFAPLAIAQTAAASGPALGSSVIWVALIACGVIAIGAIFMLVVLTGNSKRQLARSVDLRLHELEQIVEHSRGRILKFDSLIIDHLRKLSPAGETSFNVVKQTLQVMESRIKKVKKLLATGNMDDLAQAHEIVNSPIENTGDSIQSVVFSETVLSLKPDQFALGIDVMMAAVEKDMTRSPDEALSESHIGPGVARRRRFTIRGFIDSISGSDKNR